MRAFKIEGKDGHFHAIPVEVLDAEGEIDWDKVDELGEVAFLYEESDNKVYVLEYNGRVIMTTSRMADIEEEFEDKVVDALKKDGVFSEIEYSDDPDDDDELTEFRLTVLDV